MFCPKCTAPWLPGSECTECGYSPNEPAMEPPKAKPQQFCYTDNCYGEPTHKLNGKWYCKSCLDFIERQIEQQTMTKETREAISEARKYAAEHDLIRREDESPQEYATRCQKTIKSVIRKMGS